EAHGDGRAAHLVDLIARRRIVEQRLLDPAIEQHGVDQREQEIPAPVLAPVDELAMGFQHIGNRCCESSDRQGHPPEYALTAEPERQCIDRSHRALPWGEPSLSRGPPPAIAAMCQTIHSIWTNAISLKRAVALRVRVGPPSSRRDEYPRDAEGEPIEREEIEQGGDKLAPPPHPPRHRQQGERSQQESADQGQDGA